MIKQTLQGERLKAGYDRKEILHGIDITIPNHKISVIIGANACGKSTLLKSLARLIKPIFGDVRLNDTSIHSLPSKQVAKTLGLLPQSPIVPEGIKVYDLVARGRFPYQGFLSGMSKEDALAIEEAMQIMGIEELANQCVDELSGGQRQRVWIAMALAQQTEFLLLDEPTTFLDITYQIEILDLLTDLNRKRGTTIVMVLHDINLSARYADYIFAIHKGNLILEGTPNEVISESLIKQVFALDCSVMKDPVSGSPFIVPKGRYHRNC